MGQGQRVLVVDDDPRICRLIQHHLAQEGYQVLTAASGREMRDKLARAKIDLVLLDVRLPDADGLALAKELSSIPDLALIMVTGKADTLDKVVGLELGADDYVTKPFDERELLARVRSVLRRSAKTQADAGVESGRRLACFADWKLDLSGDELTAPDGSKVFLTSRELELLAVLVTHPQRVLSRDYILEQLSGREWSPIDRSIDVLIGKLRKKLGDNADHPDLIKTVRGRGYKLTAPVELR